MGAPQRKTDTTSEITNKLMNSTGDVSKKLLGMAGKKISTKATDVIKELVKKALWTLVKLVFRGFAKIFLAKFGFICALLFFGILTVYIAFTMILINYDSDLDGVPDEKGKQNMLEYINLARTTVDANFDEQLFFRVNEDLLMIAAEIGIQNGISTSKDVTDTIIKYTKPTFTYTPLPQWVEAYVEEEKCPPPGSDSPCKWVKVSGTDRHYDYKEKKLTQAFSFNGQWQLDYEENVTEWAVVNPKTSTLQPSIKSWYPFIDRREGKFRVKRRDMKQVEKRRYIAKRDISHLENALHEIGYGPLDFQLLQNLYNTKSPDLFDIYFQSVGYLDLPENIDGSKARRIDLSEELDPNLLQTEWFWPVPEIRRISSPFGLRIHPLTGKQEGHSGIDISIGGGQSGGAIVRAPRDGVVTLAGKSRGYGIAVFIKHDDLKLISELGHLQHDALYVKVGDLVKKGDPVALIGYGRVGDSSGPHLHLTIEDYRGNKYNPIRFPGIQP